MMDQANNILNSHIPATQWAMNFLNQNITQPAGQATGNFVRGFNEQPQTVPLNAGFFENTGNAVANATPVGGAEADILKGAHALTSSHAMPLALGIVGNQSTKFGNALRNAIPKAYSQPIDNEAVHYIAPALQRMLDTHTPADPNYFINQMPADHGRIASMAEAYMPGVSKILNNDPVKIAQALLERIRLDKYGK